MKVPRISNPETFVDVIYTDCGDVRPIYDKNGKVYEGFTSKFEFNGKTVKSYVSRQEALESRNPNQFLRYKNPL